MEEWTGTDTGDTDNIFDVDTGSHGKYGKPRVTTIGIEYYTIDCAYSIIAVPYGLIVVCLFKGLTLDA